MDEIKCPCRLRRHMEEEDCAKTDCDTCCPLAQTNVDRCVCCGAIIPEGQMVCPNCLVTMKDGDTDG